MTDEAPGAVRPWWKDAVVYQIYPRSFLDTDGDGIGDLGGVTARLPYLADLGVDAVWLSPIFPSPMADFGYDVSDYCGIDPVFGDLAAFDALVAEAHGLGIKVLLDWVPNHTSDQHPWFVSARSSKQSPHRDWYVWNDARPEDPPNNWRAAFADEPAWTWDEGTEQSYLRLFLKEQPDLNWSHPEVEAAMHDTLRFWLDRGVDGFRMDVVHAIGKGTDITDVPADRAAIPACALLDPPGTHDRLREIRKVLDSYPGDRVSVGEVYILDTARVATYYGTPEAPELHLSFNFPPLFARWTAAAWRDQVERALGLFGPIGAWPTWVLSNHDNPRHRTRYGSEGRARAAAVLLLGLPGTPFLYAGEELGLEDAVVPPDRVVDPGGRDGCRGPIPWSAERPPMWLPYGRGADAETQAADPGSMLSLYRSLLAARRRSEALRSGSLSFVDAPDGVLAWERTAEDGDRRLVVVSFVDEERPLPDLAGWTYEVGTHGSPPSALRPDEAAVYRR